ncbi:phage tail sheath C-terminal domain-containing protein [Jiella pelagia]|uniref:Phage tail sheath subtilisin-like domain-containing protein n=1 Tax=Jiella pelagia TaxID=2986949 RepID=A0ABY7BZU6_9HYPH|nr:phage tail sheath C-terminal domain-containing protein [Jiella pelagia]WAP69041.1 phage tail sheath subtilisin-like domain-containing protein [Jiella pelagia]
MVGFNDIPSNLRVPLVAIEFNNAGASSGSGVQPYKTLVVGQKTSGGTADALTPLRVTGADQAKQLFGAGSMLHGMAQAYFASNSFTETDFVALDDNGSHEAATGAVAFTGTPSESGTVSVYVGGRRVQVGVSTTSTGTTLATAFAAAVNAATSLPVSAAANTSTVTLTAKNKGLVGNGIDIRLNYAGETTPAGLTVNLTAMSGGTGSPDLETVWATSVSNEQYNVVVVPYTDSTSVASVKAEMERRNGPLVQMEGIAFAAVVGNQSAALTLGSGLNSQFISVMGASTSPTPAYEWAAETAAIAAYYGNIDPARPFKTLPFKWAKAATSAARFTMTERNQMLFDGVSTHTVDADGTVRIERLITTYQTNGSGGEDDSYLDVTTVLTLGYLRYSARNRLLTKYPRHKLADDGIRVGPGQAIVTPNVVKAELIALAREWEEAGLVENADVFKAGLVVERNGSDRTRLDILMTPDLVNSLQVLAGQIKFIL